MVLNSFSAFLSVFSLILLSFTLVSLFENKTLILFTYELNLLNTILILGLLVVGAFLSKIASFTVSHLGAFKLEQILRTDISSHLAKVPLGYIITQGSGGLKKVMQDDVRNLHAFVVDSTPMIARSITAPLLSLIVLFIADWRLALASLFVLFFGFIAMGYTMKDSVEYREKYEKSQTDINKAVVEFVQAMPVVRTFEDGTSSFKRYNKALKSYRENINEWMSKTAFSGKFGMVILTPLPTLLMVFLAGILLQTYFTLELSSFILALFLSTGLADSLMPLMWLNNMIKKSQTSAFKIHEVLDIKELKISKNPKSPKSYDIEFENVSFSYENSSKNALININFTLPSGSVTALVGGSGGGKSTIAKLIPRFWDVSSGSIKIGGIDIRDISYEELMKIVSFVFQDTFLFDDTIYNNIALANEKATYEEVINATKAAQIHEFKKVMKQKQEIEGQISQVDKNSASQLLGQF